MKYINEHIIVKGTKASLVWIVKDLINHNVSFSYDFMTGFLSFVQNCPNDSTCGVLSDIQRIIMTIPKSYKWDIVNQFECSYPDILSIR